MTNGHQNGQYYSGDPRVQQPAGADGPVRSHGMGAGAAGGQMPAGQPQAQPYPQGQGQVQGAGPIGTQPHGYAGQFYGYNQYGQPMYAPAQAYVAPATSQPVQVKQKRGKKAVVIAIIVALICIAAAVAIFLMMQDAPSSRQGTKGQLEGKTEAEIQAELDRVVEDGMFNISIASVVEFADGASEGELRIENVPGNQYLMQVTIARDDTGDVVYTSDIIEPDYHIQRDTLDVDLSQGTYPCTATFVALDPETEMQIGQAAARITIKVLG